MSEHFALLVPGAKDAGRKIDVSAPWDGAPIAQLAAIDHAGVEQALQTAYAIFRDKDRWLPPAARIDVLEKTAAIMAQRAEMLALEAAREGGKPLIDSRVEVARAIDGVRNCVECIRADTGTEIPMNLNPASANRLAMTRKEPIGVVVAVSAFNHPLNLIVHQVGPAVASGCPVIVKPAEDTPLSCFRFVRILREAGLPDEYCQALVVDDLDVATQLVTDARVGFFSFIGSAKVGWMLRSKLAPGARCALEHGGAAPVIMAEDADLDDILPVLAKGGFYHAGQVCVSVQRLFAHRSIAKEVARRMGELADAMTVGDPTLERTEVGPLIRHREADRVAQWVDEAVGEGAQLITGGNRLSNSTYACTVLYDPPAQSKVSTAEIFGPVVCVYPYADALEAIERANNLPFAFQAAVSTRNIDFAMRCYRRLDASAIMINDHTAFRVDWMPFAGLRQSGLGVGGIPYTFEDMQIEKMMVLRSKEL
ncbi:MAG: aldehyde dehydrogenase family protein [Gammaproteobacteria bacterium]